MNTPSENALQPEGESSTLITLARLSGWTQELMRAAKPEDAMRIISKALTSAVLAHCAAALASRGGALLHLPFAGEVFPEYAELLRQHIEEGILDWALREGRACFLPSFEPDVPGDVALLPLWKTGECKGIIWAPCALRHEAVTPEVLNFLKILSGPASAALLA